MTGQPERGAVPVRPDDPEDLVGERLRVARHQREAEQEPGDLLVAYTDGIVEPENVYGEMFGEDRLKDLVIKYARADSAEMIARTMESVVQWTGAGELQDDMTMVVVRRI